MTPPFKLLTLPSRQKQLQAIQMSSSPGILAGDRLKLEIKLAENTDLKLTTQAFNRVQSMGEGQWAEQHQRFNLAAHSRLCYLPYPTVLHKDSELKQTTEIYMAEHSKLIYADIIATGRVLNQECFAFRQFSSSLSIYYQQKPLLLDRIILLPRNNNPTALSQMENYSHQGGLVYINLQQDSLSLKALVAKLQQQYADYPALVGISLLAQGGFCVRAMAKRADLLERLVGEIAGEVEEI